MNRKRLELSVLCHTVTQIDFYQEKDKRGSGPTQSAICAHAQNDPHGAVRHLIRQLQVGVLMFLAHQSGMLSSAVFAHFSCTEQRKNDCVVFLKSARKAA